MSDQNTHPPIDENAAWEVHNAKWEPILAAYAMAKAMETLAECLPKLADNPEALEAYLPGLGKHKTIGGNPILPGICDMWKRKAEKMRALFPLGVTDEQRWDVAYANAECENDLRTKERAHAILDDQTDAAVAEQIAREALERAIYGE